MPASPSRYRQLRSDVVIVAISEDGIRIFESPEGLIDDSSLLISILKSEICLTELKPFFRHERDADDILAVFNRQFLEERMEAEEKAWRHYEMPDKGLMLAKTFNHHSSKYPNRFMPITVGIRSNGLFLYRQALSKQSPPRFSDLFLKIKPRDIEPQPLSELFEIMVAAEITAAYRMNRRELIRLLQRKEEDDMPARQDRL